MAVRYKCCDRTNLRQWQLPVPCQTRYLSAFRGFFLHVFLLILYRLVLQERLTCL